MASDNIRTCVIRCISLLEPVGFPGGV